MDKIKEWVGYLVVAHKSPKQQQNQLYNLTEHIEVDLRVLGPRLLAVSLLLNRVDEGFDELLERVVVKHVIYETRKSLHSTQRTRCCECAQGKS